MYQYDHQLRVRYGETDRMGYAYYGWYATYFEAARVEALRDLGFAYRKLEDSGMLLPVLDFQIRYRQPAYYDDLLRIRTVIPELPGARLRFTYETYRGSEALNTAETTLVFVDRESRRPRPAPEALLQALRPHFASGTPLVDS